MIVKKGAPVIVAHQRGFVDIVHAGAFELGMVEWKAARLYHMHRAAHAGRKPQGSAEILRDIRFDEYQVKHGATKPRFVVFLKELIHHPVPLLDTARHLG